MGAYQEHLRHVAEPQAPSERRKAVGATIADYEALWFADILREYSHYGDHDEDVQSGIAVAYASFIDKKIRDEGKSHVTLYTHTEIAAQTLLDALYDAVPDPDDREDFPMVLSRAVESAAAEAFAHYVDESELEEPPEPQVDEDLGVVFDPEEAKDSYMEMQMEKAESAHLKQIEDRRERAMDEGRL